jgi:putative endonuclease
LAQKAKTIVLVEVKTKSTDQFGAGSEMVNYYKAKKLLNLAKSLQIRYPKNVIRIDVISVDLSSDSPHIEHFENAVQEN